MKQRKRQKNVGCFKYMLVLVALISGSLYLSGNEIIQLACEMVTEIPYAEITIDTSTLHARYYYEKLPETEQLAYQEILQGIEENAEEIYVHSDDAKRTNEIFEYVLNDFPHIFWCDVTASSTVYESSEKYTVLKPVYTCDGEEKARREQLIEQKVIDFIKTIPKDATEYEKILAVYEYVIQTVEYDINTSDNQNIYSVFANEKSVCAGYSKATQYLLEKLDVFCIYVTGKTYENQSHAWNIVRCDGDYYYVDTTWGDPVFQETDNDWKGQISYDFFCCSEEQIQNTHLPDEEIELPICEKMDWNYYVVNEMYYTKYDRETILESMQRTITNGENPSVFKFSSQDIYEEAQKDIFENIIKKAAQSLGEQYGLSTVHYEYLDESILNKITIYWQYE